MAQKTYKALGPAREAFGEAIRAAVTAYEKAGGVRIDTITLKRYNGQVREVRINQ